jgi:hypothetical protein
LERADDLARDVFNAYGAVRRVAPLTREFSTLLKQAYMYRTMSEVADYHREHNVLIEQEGAKVKAMRQLFAESCKALCEKHATPSRAQ